MFSKAQVCLKKSILSTRELLSEWPALVPTSYSVMRSSVLKGPLLHGQINKIRSKVQGVFFFRVWNH